jgi:tryptophanyl-tRNA synthetase
MDLQNPADKMSKSEESPQGTVNLLDPPDAVRKKFKSAVTDSGREVRAAPDKPAITNLLTIFAAVTGRAVADVEADYEGKGYGDFKGDLADAVVAFLEPIQKRYEDLASDEAGLRATLTAGAEKAQAVARATVATVYERIGFVARG